MGEDQSTLFPLEFNHSVKLRSAPDNLTANAGAALLREMGERLGLWKLLERALVDLRDPDLITHPFEELLRTAVWSRQRDVDFLRRDPAFRLAVSKRRSESPLAWEASRAGARGAGVAGHALQEDGSPGRAGGPQGTGRSALCLGGPPRWPQPPAPPGRDHGRPGLSAHGEVHGHQPGSAYNGHYH